ncbi:hypothetical protein [Helicobacter sp. 11S03491-1]|uniref:hypothetical protein n=1 Tax=Helicobacter sp. 11S03491-1 TaxID=1476196 RepID=UPI000BA6F371|nr:hypothetical protein [Helicobacter sp. 11S03491-1]PAF41166.1 hypothetical protein BKH45_08030 [Helicobacter sp. 11S03491-1]
MRQIKITPQIKLSSIIISISITCGVVIFGIYFYQTKIQINNTKITQPQPKYSPHALTKIPQKVISSAPHAIMIPKPTFYMGTILGTLTYNHALKIAKDYYENQSYENAMIWAYRANQINHKDLKSWVVYTQSLSKIGRQKEAQELMQQAQKVLKIKK